jgi:hypothetical protein
MRIIAHLISVALLVPGIIVATAFVALGHMTGQPDFGHFVTAVLDVLLVFFPLGLLIIVLWLVLAVLGISQRWQRAAAICVGSIAAGTSLVILWPVGDSTAPLGIVMPAVGSLVIAIWLASTEPPAPASIPVAAPQPPADPAPSPSTSLPPPEGPRPAQPADPR